MNPKEESEIDLLALFQLLLRKAHWIIATAVVFGIAAFLITYYFNCIFYIVIAK